MSAIVGVYDPCVGVSDVHHTLATMRRTLEVPSLPQRMDEVAGIGAGCATVEYRTQRTSGFARHASRGLWLALVGEIYDRDGLLARLPEAAPPGDDADLCLRLYLNEGATFVEHLNGHFNIVLYDEPQKRLSIASDPFGYRPLFLASDGQRHLFASEMKAILAVLERTPTVDGIGLLELVRQRWPLGERTWIDDIRVAPPGTWFDMTPGGVSRRRYFRFRFRADRGLSLPSYLEGFAEKVRRATRRAVLGAERVGIALSGGLDSRTLLLAAGAEPKNLWAYTFGKEDSRDVSYAAQLARVAGVPHRHLPYDPGYLGRCLVAIVWRSEGLLPFSEATFTSLHFHRVLAEHADVLLYGHAGDALTGAHLPLRALLWRSKERLIERVFQQYNRMPEAMLSSVFNPTFYRRFAADLFESLRASFADIDAEEAADVLDSWDMENRQRRGIFASTVIDRHRFGVRAPFLDRELVDHLRCAPTRWRVQQMAYKQMITTAFPHAASVPWTHTGRRLQSQPLADLATQASGYIRRHLPAASGGAAHSFRSLCADTRADRVLPQVIRAFAADSSFPAEVFDRRGIEAVVQRHWERGEDLTSLVSILATMATAYRLFIWQRPSTIPAEAIAISL